MKPVVTELYREGYDIRTVDVRGNRELAAKYRVRSIPTFILIRHGQEVRRLTGSVSSERLAKLFRHALP